LSKDNEIEKPDPITKIENPLIENISVFVRKDIELVDFL